MVIISKRDVLFVSITSVERKKRILLDLAKLELSCHSVEPVNCEMFRRKKLAKVDSLFQ